MGDGRTAAVEALTACRRLDAWSDSSLKAACRGLDRRDAALAARLTYGILQNRALLDFYLDHYCTQEFSRLEPFVRDVLRLGAFQILFMDRVPDHAAVDQAVEMVKRKKRSRAAGLINAVLRRLSREKENLPALPHTTPAAYLALQYSHPVWLVERLLQMLGQEETEEFLRLNNDSVPTVIQCNLLRCSSETLSASLTASGGQVVPHPWMPNCLLLSGSGDLEAMPAFQEGMFLVQDAAARAAVLAAGIESGARVLDVCAAPGGKSFAAAIQMEDRGEIISCDIHPHRLELIQRGAARLGLHCLHTELADGRQTKPEWIDGFDVVLCDVPCSGLGIIRKKPDIRYKNPTDLAGLPRVQQAILDNACRYVAKGGILLYSTCTILPEENEGVTADFLDRHTEFRREAFSLPGLGDTEEGMSASVAAASQHRRILHLQDEEAMNKEIRSMTLEELTEALQAMGEPAFRGKQIFSWLHRGVSSFDEMSDISKSLRERLSREFCLAAPRAVRKQVSQADGTIKYLWELHDSSCIETVLMQYRHGNTVCISTQVGCRMGCAFCASTIGGKVRDLQPSEMLEQVMFAQIDSGIPISNIVLMGIGEPMDNLDNVLRFLELVNHPLGLGIGMRHISLSTCGVIPGIRRLAELSLQLTLSVSLHAPDSETRSRIMPVNRAYDVEALFAACHDYFQKTGRRISFEYAMIDGVNDHDWQADRIVRKLRGMPGHVNLIPLNDVAESPLKPSRRLRQFQRRLEDQGVTATVRRSLGGDIDASCGQLRRKAMENEKEGAQAMMNVWGMTDIGLVRRENQDAYAVRFGEESGFTICVVCDGMGGPGGGKLASTLAVEAFLSTCLANLQRDMDVEQVREVAAFAVAAANTAVYERASREKLRGMGTTLVSAIAQDGQALLNNVGDSRAYLIRSGNPPEEAISRITKDHSLVERLVDNGAITKEEARRYPGRNLITRALGPEEEALSDSYLVQLEPGDYLLLCTDGLINTATDQEMAREILRSGEDNTCLDRLLEIARGHGAPDNVTAVLLQQQ